MEMDSESKQTPQPSLVVLPSTGMGHLIPFLEMTKRLASFHAFSITLITTNSNLSPRQMPFAQNFLLSHNLPHIRYIELPEVHIESAQKMKPVTLKSKLTEKSRGLLENLLTDLLTSSPICAFVTDMFSTPFLDVTVKLGIPGYIFMTSSASFLSFMLHMPELDARHAGISFKDMESPVEDIPGLSPMDAGDLPSSVQNRSDEVYDCFLRNCRSLRKADGVVINTFRSLERPVLEALESGGDIPPVYAVGPIVSEAVVNSEESGCVKWLDRHPPRSVIFVSFGSEAFLSGAQIIELAAGLEGSGQRFLWVLRAPPGSEPAELLPEGFEARNADRGLVVSAWTPQVSILGHPSTGVFVSHCGWNSTLESICCGVPMVAWPIQAEQKMNRHLVVKELGAAIEVKMGAEGMVGREEVERAAREVIEGKEVRRRMRELQESAQSAVEQGGTSYDSLFRLVSEWKRKAVS